MYYYLYEVKNKLDGKIYIGVHKTKKLDDGYMGSGSIIATAVKKHGKENFTKTVLEMFDNPESMYAKEMEIVTYEFLKRSDTYNIKLGGLGGFDHINSRPKENRINILAWKEKHGRGEIQLGGTKHWNAETRDKCSNQLRKNIADGITFGLGSKHNDATKRKMSEKASGSKNSQHGMRHFVNEDGDRLICKKGEEPFGYISVRDKYEDSKSSSNRRWFNDGYSSYMMASIDPRVVEFDLKPGRLSKLQAT